VILPVGFAIAFAIAAYAVVPQGIEGGRLLVAQDDPVALADHTVARLLDAEVTRREIEQALDADDPDLAKSFVDLARERGIKLDPELIVRVETAVAAANSTSAHVQKFAHGLITGEPDDLVGFAGTALGDLFVFGDIRDAVREGKRLITGEDADELILGLSCVGLAITAGTYATLGVGAPARVGLSVLKAARKTGAMSARLAGWLGRSLREAIDMASLRRAVSGVSLAEPAVAVRAAREAVKVEKSGALLRVVGDVGRVQSKAGTRAALDGLRIAQGPRDMTRIARLAEAKGGKTRAILKLGGRAAIVLTANVFNLFVWLLGALMTLYGFCASCKRATERATERHLARRRARRERRLAAMAANA
jgi:hypothetical protein